LKLRPIAALVLSAFAILPAAAAVNVRYGNPDHFSDAGDRNNDPVKLMKNFAEFMKGLGKYLPPGTDVDIEVLDLDRAGRTRMNLPTEMRVMNGKADPPCMDLRYSVKRDGHAGEPRKERLCDTDYLRPLGPRDSQHDALVYEKRMFEEWFRQRFAAPGGEPR
jgi:hypothetical protein